MTNTQQQKTQIADTASPLTWLALGDSYTIGESVESQDRYVMQAKKILDEEGIRFQEPEIIATTGWTTADLQHAMDKYAFKQSYSLVTLLIGVNNQYQGKGLTEYSREFSQLLTRSILLAGNNHTHVIVLSIPDYSVTPFASDRNRTKIAEEIKSFNSINRKIAEEMGVKYLDITPDSRMALQNSTLVASDGLHFSGKEYQIWATKLLPLIREIVN
jgi:lysophospholipase L1-like esterase